MIGRGEFKGPGRQRGFTQFIAAAATAAQAAFGFAGAGKAEKAARKAARRNALNQTIQMGERLRRSEEQEERLAGTTRAAAAASGVRVGEGSPLDVLAEQASEFARERQWIRYNAREAARAGFEGAEMAADQARAGALGTAFSSLTQLAGMAYEYGWGRTTSPRRSPQTIERARQRPVGGMGPVL